MLQNANLLSEHSLSRDYLKTLNLSCVLDLNFKFCAQLTFCFPYLLRRTSYNNFSVFTIIHRLVLCLFVFCQCMSCYC